MSLRNRIAARILDKLIELVPTMKHETEPKPAIWKYTIEDYTDGSPYLTRVLFPRVPWLGFRPMLHKFHRPDGDRALHNHPWRWAVSLVLAGEYIEERLLPDESRLAGKPDHESRLVRWFNVLTDRDYHRITELRGSVYTLFVIGPRTQGWGFLEDDGSTTDWQAYIAARKRELELPAATGNALDHIGATYDVKRYARLEWNPSTLAMTVVWAETDAAYRARIVATLKNSK